MFLLLIVCNAHYVYAYNAMLTMLTAKPIQCNAVHTCVFMWGMKTMEETGEIQLERYDLLLPYPSIHPWWIGVLI